MNMDQALQTFFDESRDLLDEMERILLASEDEATSMDELNALFRAMHTIKGSAGLFALDGVVQFTHQVENVLDQLRSGSLTLDPDLVGLLLRCHDHVQALLQEAGGGPIASADQGAALLGDLAAWLGKTSGEDHHALAASLAVHASAEPQPETLEDAAVSARWLLSLRFSPDLLRNGMDPASFLRYLQSMGQIEAIRALDCNLPAGAAFDPETLYLRFELVFFGQVEAERLADTFEFAREGSRLLICRLQDAAAQAASVLDALAPEEAEAVRQAWRDLGVPEATAVATSDTPSEPSSDDTSSELPASLLAVAEGKPAVADAGKSQQPRAAESKFIKVEAWKLDNLIDLIGELVIAGAAASLVAQRTALPSMVEATQSIATLVEQIRAGTLSMRMIQIGEIFQRFPRVVRDVSKDLNKDIDLRISGADTELDKSMVDKLGDPLMHIVRNAIDHGIESRAQRIERGKPPCGTVWLNAYHESGSVVIEVADDGAGLDQARILAKAIERGLLPPDAQPTEAEIFKLIFEPGFSTAAQVTNISGRGVGMDVVRKSIDQLRGSIDIDSQLQQGTTFRIRLPLTLAIIDGFLVQVGPATFVLPLETVIECIELPEIQQQDGVDHLNLRGEILPLLRLSSFFELAAGTASRQNVVVVRFGDHKAGLVVDALLGEFQTVIKPLGSLFRHLKTVSGSTILGTGEVALILDVNALIQFATHKESQVYSLESAMARRGRGLGSVSHS